MPLVPKTQTEDCEFCIPAEETVSSLMGTSSLSNFFGSLLTTDGFPPRWECGTAWTPALGWLHIVADLAIFGAYLAIPVVLAAFITKRGDLPFPPILWLFVAFIAFCGIGHCIEATIFWIPWYRLAGVIKGVTAVISWITVLALIRVVPQALKLPGLAIANEQLRETIRQNVETKQSLIERTEQLEELNDELAVVSRMTVAREDRVFELKREVNELLERAGISAKYSIPDPQIEKE